MKKTAILIAILFMTGCTAGTVNTQADYVCPVPLVIPVEKPKVVAPAPVVIPAPVPVVEKKVEVIPFYFDFDKSDPSKNVKAVTAAVAALGDKSKTAELQGNCDMKGSAAYNMKLGDRRAKEVKAILVKNGVDERQLSTVSFGKSKAKGKTDKERSLDRRVDIVVK